MFQISTHTAPVCQKFSYEDQKCVSHQAVNVLVSALKFVMSDSLQWPLEELQFSDLIVFHI